MDINNVIKKILLNINYDNSKTLNENRIVLEQPTATAGELEQGPVIDSNGKLTCKDNNPLSFFIDAKDKKREFCGYIKNTLKSAPEVLTSKNIHGLNDVFQKNSIPDDQKEDRVLYTKIVNVLDQDTNQNKDFKVMIVGF